MFIQTFYFFIFLLKWNDLSMMIVEFYREEGFEVGVETNDKQNERAE